MTHRPYPETPEAAARNARIAEVLALIDELAPNRSHGRRARVRVAGLYGMATATDDEVRLAVTATAPVEAPAFIEQPYTQEDDAA